DAQVADRDVRELGILDLADELVQAGNGRDAHQLAPGCARATTWSSPTRYEKAAEWRPLRPPVCITPAAGSVSGASSSASPTVACHACLIESGSAATPAATSSRSTSSASNSSPVNRHSASTARCALR